MINPLGLCLPTARSAQYPQAGVTALPTLPTVAVPFHLFARGGTIRGGARRNAGRRLRPSATVLRTTRGRPGRNHEREPTQNVPERERAGKANVAERGRAGKAVAVARCYTPRHLGGSRSGRRGAGAVGLDGRQAGARQAR